MDDLVSFLKVLFAVLVLVVIAAGAIWVFYQIEESKNPYRDGDIRYYKYFGARTTFIAETVAGFKIPYDLHLMCERVENEEFNRELMLEKSSHVRLADAYCEEFLRPALKQYGCFFNLSAHKSKVPKDMVTLEMWRIVERQGNFSVEELFVQMLILHLASSFLAKKLGMYVQEDGLRLDIKNFFSFPIPKLVWEKSKIYQDTDFVEFVESCM